MKSKLVHLILWSGLITLCVGVWPSDRWPLISMLAYTPSLLLLTAGLLNLLLIRTLAKDRQRTMLSLNLLLLAAVFLIVAADNRQFFRSTNPESSNHKVRILHWNVWGSRNGYGKISEEIRRRNPSIVFLSEPILHPRNEIYPDYQHSLGGRWYAWGEGNLLTLSKFPYVKKDTLDDAVLKGMYFEVAADRTLKLLFLDMDPDLRNSRRTAFKNLSRWMAQKNWKPDVILGDLNTPASAFSLRETFSHDYYDCYFFKGHGLGYTWPSWFPISRIDQMYTQKNLRISRYESLSSQLSDHRMHWIDIDQSPATDIHSKNE